MNEENYDKFNFKTEHFKYMMMAREIANLANTKKLHNDIIEKLDFCDISKTILNFDDELNTLSFADENIKISERADSDAHELLRTLFKNKSKLWDNDDILDDWKFCLDKKRIPKNKVYHAGKSVNRIIAQETKIKDFLILTTKTTAINKKYLNE